MLNRNDLRWIVITAFIVGLICGVIIGKAFGEELQSGQGSMQYDPDSGQHYYSTTQYNGATGEWQWRSRESMDVGERESSGTEGDRRDRYMDEALHDSD